MTTNTSAVRPKTPLSPLTLVSSAFFILFGILSIVSAVLSIGVYLSNLGVLYEIREPRQEWIEFEIIRNTIQLVMTIIAPFAAIAITLSSLVFRRRWLPSITGLALVISVFAFPLIVEFLLRGFVESYIPSVIELNSSFNVFEKPLGFISFMVMLLAVGLSVVAAALRPKSFAQNVQTEEVVAQMGNQPSKISATQTSGHSNLNNLPLFALIGAFVVPLAGIILGHLSLSYMKKGQLSTQNKGMATAGLILGYVFVGLGFLTGLILVIVLIVSAASGF